MNEKKLIEEVKGENSCCSSGAPCCGGVETKLIEEVKEENSCCSSGVSCCGGIETTQIKVLPETRIRNSEKLKVDIFVPLNACSCEWSQFMNLIFATLTPYIKHIDHQTKSIQSEEARELNIRSKCVVVDGTKKFTTSFALKKELPRILKEKGLV